MTAQTPTLSPSDQARNQLEHMQVIYTGQSGDDYTLHRHTRRGRVHAGLQWRGAHVALCL